MFKYHKLHLFSLLSILILSFTLINICRSFNSKTILIDGDGSGHYSWLPSIFIYNSIDFNEVFEAEKLRKGPDYQGHNYNKINGTLINKFPPGTALLIAPFFLVAFLISLILGHSPNGYSIIFQYSVGIAALFWSFVGLWNLFKLLLLYRIKQNRALFIVIAAFLGTNLFAYTILMPSFSHAYSFSIISVLLYYTKVYFLKREFYALILSAVLLGLVFLIRPINILIILFLPFLASNPKTLGSGIRNIFKRLNLVLTVGAALIFVIPYFLINYLQTGLFLFDTYNNEGFYWSNPQVLNFLFSFRKGWFVYTPLFLLIFPAIYFNFRRNKFEVYWFLIFSFVLIYMFSSWWNWFYGDSFGMRPMVDFTVVYILFIALYLKYLKNDIKSFYLSLILLFIGLNLVQSYQYARGIIHPDSMNREAYLSVFLKTDSKHIGSISGGHEYYYGTMNENPFYKEFNDFEKDYDNWAKLWNPEVGIKFSGKKSVRLNAKNIYSPSLSWTIPDSLMGSRNLYVKIETQIFEMEQNAAKNALFIMDIKNNDGKTVFYKKTKLKQIPNKLTNRWFEASTGIKLPHLNNNHNLVKIYIWNVKKKEFIIDDLDVNFFDYY
jgi:hypothetical protein